MPPIQPTSPTKELEITPATLPDGNRTEEQKAIADRAVTRFERRERQEEQLNVQQLEISSSPTALTSTRGAATAAARNREQNDQLNHTEGQGAATTTKRAKGKRSTEADSTVRQLSSVLGPEAANALLDTIERRAREHGSGLTVSAPELQQLAAELSVALKGISASGTPTISSSSSALSQEQIIARLAIFASRNNGTLKPEDIVEAIFSDDAANLDVHPRTSELQVAIEQILAEARDPIGEIATFRSTLPEGDLTAFREAITRVEVLRGKLVLEEGLARCSRDRASYSRAIDMYMNSVVAEENHAHYMQVFVERRYEAGRAEYRGMGQQRIQLLQEQRDAIAQSDSLRHSLLTSLSDIHTRFGFIPCPRELSAQLAQADPRSGDFLLLYAEVATLSARTIRSHAAERTDLSAEGIAELNLLADEIDSSTKQTAELASRITVLGEELHVLSTRLRSYWHNFEELYGRALERLGLTQRVYIPLHHFVQSEPLQASSPSTHDSRESAPQLHFDTKIKEIVREQTHGTSEPLRDEKKEMGSAERREEADIERSIAEMDARRFATCGDFMNAEAEITAYNNRFPDFPISRDFIRVMREKFEVAKAEMQSA